MKIVISPRYLDEILYTSKKLFKNAKMSLPGTKQSNVRQATNLHGPICVCRDRHTHTSFINGVALGARQINLTDILKTANNAGIKRYYIEDENDSAAVHVPQKYCLF